MINDIKKNIQENFIDIDEMNRNIDEIIVKNAISKKNNYFFNLTSSEDFSPKEAYQIAGNWLQITKTFMFTVIQGLGVLSSSLLKSENPVDSQLLVLQTAVYVISDDLNNCHPIFKKVSPKGPRGVHYRWWENTILEKLQSIVHEPVVLTESVTALLSKMHELTDNIMGAAVQLRIVEAIAFDISSSFLVIFGSVKHNGELVFPNDGDKAWITAHIEAETVHNQQVSNTISGMAKIAQTFEEQQLMLDMANNYAKVWALALDSFMDILRLR